MSFAVSSPDVVAETQAAEGLPAGIDASGRLTRLALTRVVLQGLGFAWFVLAARRLPSAELGTLSGGLALIVLIGGLSDLGVSRSVVRHVAAAPAAAGSNLRRALALRVTAGVGLGLIAVAVLPALSDLSPLVVALSAWTATASGTTEAAFACLRSVGRTRVEVGVLLIERVLFTVLAICALELGIGPVGLLVIYAATNSLSAFVGATIGSKLGDRSTAAGRYLDREGRQTAVVTALQTLGPRAGLVLLVLVGSAREVAGYAVAQKPTEALALLLAALAAPALPTVRAAIVGGRVAEASMIVGHVAAAGSAVAAGVLGWMVADPEGGLRLLLGTDPSDDAARAMRCLALAGLLAIVRGALELLLLAEERARSVLRATAIGMGVTVAIGALLVGSIGAAGVALAALAGELTASLLVGVSAIRGQAGWRLLRPLVPSMVIWGTIASIVAFVDATPRVGLAVAALGSVVGLVEAGRQVHAVGRVGI